jgi:hypothetical protein
MDVMNVEQAKIAEEAGAAAVMALGVSLDPISASCSSLFRSHDSDHSQSASPPISAVTEVSPAWYVYVSFPPRAQTPLR